MKLILALVVAFTSLSATAQSRKVVKKSNSSSEMSLDSSDGTGEVMGKVGFTSGAINVGADYNKMEDGMGLGGYFFYQQSKKTGGVTIVPGMISFGATYKVNFIDNSKLLAFVAPGFGIHMAKDVGTSDETLIGPALKIGTQFKVKPTFAIGIERQALVNWFNDKVAGGEFAFYSIAGTFWF